VSIAGFPGVVRDSGGDRTASGYTTVAMFSPAYRGLAERLKASLISCGLHYFLYEVPAVHRSISSRGVDDLSLTKAALIRFAWNQHQGPVLYLDCDVVAHRPPRRFAELQHAGRDFAIYNWLADEYTDCLVPVSAQGLPPGRIYRYSHAIDLYGPEQLICSGAVQYWAPTTATRLLLDRWLDAQQRFQDAADDECLDYAFNNMERGTPSPAYAWLDKAYARYAWWPHVEPVLDHPQFPVSRETKPIPTRVHLHRLETRRAARAIPRDCLVDVVARRLLRAQPAQPGSPTYKLVDVGAVDAEFFPSA
jgi:hypothetical protein